MSVARRSPSSLPSSRPDPAFERELTALLPDLRRHALRWTRNGVLAEDVLQDTLERALRFSGSFERGTNLHAWTRQILFRTFITRCRRSRRERLALRVLSSDPCAWTLPEASRAPECSTLCAPLARKLDALPGMFREVIALVDLGHHTYREAAIELGLPLGTVMSRLHRGRKLLAAELPEAA